MNEAFLTRCRSCDVALVDRERKTRKMLVVTDRDGE